MCVASGDIAEKGESERFLEAGEQPYYIS
jgi:hypothetical protein